ncbi:mechanosensitive ion channel family protein [Rhodohalobacter mucosus]|nr:mechanosensitive ion channel domain-containing protein [Rhodohalobacter mucosus]
MMNSPYRFISIVLTLVGLFAVSAEVYGFPSEERNYTAVSERIMELPVQSDTTGTNDLQSGSESAADTSGGQNAVPAGNQDTANGLTGTDAQQNIAQIRELISFGKIFYSFLILFFTYYINKYLSLILDNLSEKLTNYRLFIKRLVPISRILIWSFAIYIVIAGVIVPPLETIITIAASVGIAVGFASQDILKNIFGGIMIILDRPFQVGDKIQVGEHYGEVQTIGLRSSRVVTPDDSVVSIPNAELMNKAVSNSNSSALDCQVVAEIYLPASTDVAKAKQIAFRAVYSSPYTFMNKPVDVIVLNEMNEKFFLMKMRVKAYVLDIRYEFLFMSDVTELILSELNRQGLIPDEIYQEGKGKKAAS